MAIKKHRRISKYAESLLLDARRLGTISVSRVAEIRASYAALAGSLAKNAQEALHVIRSVWYAVDSYLSTLPTQKEALHVLVNTPAEEVWQAGLRTLRRLSYEVALLAIRTNQNRLILPNADYNRVPNLARQFLSHYNIRTGAHKTSMQIHYTPLVPVPRQTGLYYLRLYLMFLYYEDKFCHDCGIEAVEDCYGTYCFARDAYDMEFLHVNVYKILFTNAIFAHYLNYDPGTFLLQKDDVALAQKLLSSLTLDGQREALRQVVLRLPYGNISYNLCALSTIFPTLHDAIARGRLADVLLVES